ncbi:MAG: efflux RND transporter periplasmic adaptor subunit [Gemmataceae bacterium]|nr:efflux RND transporter periplasmic adaptor subunit [Gemmataceae bacterium]
MLIARYRILISMSLFVMASASLVGCKKEAAAPPNLPPPKVTVARPVSHMVQGYYEYNGHLDAVESVEIRARVKGLLKEIHFVEGEEVEANAPLYSIDPREYNTSVARNTAELAKAKAEIDNWKAQIKLAETELGRLTRLPAGSVTQSEIDKARAMVEVNVAQLGVAMASKESAAATLQTATIQLGYTDIRAPIAGRISRTHVTKGNLVGQDQTTLLTTIVSVDPVYILFDAPERDLSKYQRTFSGKSGDPEVLLEVGITNEVGYPHRGKIDFRENKVDPGTGTIRLRGRVPNPGTASSRVLYPGLYTRVRVLAGGPEPQLVIPEEALMTGQEGRFVFVLGAGDVVEKRPVTVGARVWQALASGEVGAPGWVLSNPNPSPATDNAKGPAPLRLPVRSVVAIEKGLKPDDRIVVVGLQRARPGAPVTPDMWNLQAPKSLTPSDK